MELPRGTSVQSHTYRITQRRIAKGRECQVRLLKPIFPFCNGFWSDCDDFYILLKTRCTVDIFDVTRRSRSTYELTTLSHI